MMSLNKRILLSATGVLLIFIVGIALALDRAFYDSARLGPRTELAGLLMMIWPTTSQSKSMRMAARCCLTEGGDRLV